MQRKALGKGLEALFGSTAEESGPGVSSVPRIVTVPVKDIVPNRNQPRERFSDDAMEDLKRSIAENGVLEPPVVRRNGEVFELIAGERRFRAVKALGNDTIDVIVMDMESDEKALVLSLVENIQRENLNAIEEARACRKIMENMEITQEELADIVGKSRSAVANTLRLLSLPDEIQGMVKNGELAPGSARALIT
ncbi:MAG: ParB/RepB/Spo0J family partition protein, partial [Candidatus Latescibacteria bacterium]|nr:ParB/RepB/Spo0J family partition protein [Candidatus Latescibacterota bacterium]